MVLSCIMFTHITRIVDEIVCGVSDYGMQVPGFVAKGNVFGAQFHPKKWRNWHANIKNFQGW